MTNTTPKKQQFDSTLDFENLDEDEQHVHARRLATYSIEALKTAVPVDKIFVQHPDFANAVKALDRVFQLAPEVDMPHGLTLVGPTGVGKTAVFRYFMASLPESNFFSPGFGAIAIRAQEQAKVGQIISAILRAYKYPFPIGTGKQLYIRRNVVFDAIKQKGTRLLFVDEAHHLVKLIRSSSSTAWEIGACEFLREIMDVCKIAIVLAGSNQLDELSKLDPHLASRVSVREEMRQFDYGAQWMGLLRGFAARCSHFDIKLITDNAIAKRLHLATDGNLRSLKRLLTEAVLIAAENMRERLDLATVSKAFELVAGGATLRSNPFA